MIMMVLVYPPHLFLTRNTSDIRNLPNGDAPKVEQLPVDTVEVTNSCGVQHMVARPRTGQILDVSVVLGVAKEGQLSRGN